VNVTATQTGSFENDLEVVQSYLEQARGFLVGDDVTAALNLVTLVMGAGGSLVWLLRKLRGRKPDRVEKLSPDMVRLTLTAEGPPETLEVRPADAAPVPGNRGPEIAGRRRPHPPESTALHQNRRATIVSSTRRPLKGSSEGGAHFGFELVGLIARGLDERLLDCATEAELEHILQRSSRPLPQSHAVRDSHAAIDGPLLILR
jgi:hypothetical protein